MKRRARDASSKTMLVVSRSRMTQKLWLPRLKLLVKRVCLRFMVRSKQRRRRSVRKKLVSPRS